MKSFFDPMPRSLAHRGDSLHYPENTALSFAAAIDLGVDVIETDVHLTADGEVLIWHDENFTRVSGDKRQISQIRSTELAESTREPDLPLTEEEHTPLKRKESTLSS